MSGFLLFQIALFRNFNKINKSPAEIEQPSDRYSLKNTGLGPANLQPSTSVDIANLQDVGCKSLDYLILICLSLRIKGFCFARLCTTLIFSIFI